MFSCEQRNIFCRPALEQDEELFFKVFYDTRIEEIKQAGWNEPQINEFMTMQFRAQTMHYSKHYPDSERWVLLHNDIPVGRLLLEYWDDQVRIIDVAVLIEHRNKGVGGFVVKQVMSKADELGLPLSIHVERYNPAMALYKRLGFNIVEEGDVYHLLQYSNG